MEIYDKHDKDYIEVWLTNAEQQLYDRRKLTRCLLEKANTKKCKVVYFLSGSDDLLGGVNGDGMADSVDSSMILVHNTMAADNKKYLTDDQIWCADINDDLLVDSVDVSLILAYDAYIADDGEQSFIEWYETLIN